MSYFQRALPDGGPVYTETNLEHAVAEPWNTASAAIFLLVVAYWAFKLKGKYKKYRFLSWMVPVLAIGGVGGVLYHATRWSIYFLLMDWLPIVIISVSGGIYLARKSFFRKRLIVVFFAFHVLFQAFAPFVLPLRVANNLSYFMLCLMILLPLGIFLHKTKYYNFGYVVFAVLSFLVALFCRIADPWVWLPMGTHFLWHLFGALSCHLMFLYLFAMKEPRVQDLLIYKSTKKVEIASKA